MSEVSLVADCAQCVGLCCVAPAFDRSAEFAIDKPAGVACPNLTKTHACAIHASLAEHGFGGCVRFDCLGAGQRVTAMFAPSTWRDGEDVAAFMFDAFRAMRRVHDLILLLREAGRLPMTADQRQRCDALLAELHPDAWTVATLQAFERGRLPRDVSDFLSGLRDLVSAARL